MNGYLPWFSPEAAPSEVWVIARLPVAKSEEVCKCLSCPFAECRNCIGKRKDDFKAPHRPPVYDVTIIRQLVNSGADSKTISKEVGCSDRTARRYIRKYVVSA